LLFVFNLIFLQRNQKIGSEPENWFRTRKLVPNQKIGFEPENWFLWFLIKEFFKKLIKKLKRKKLFPWKEKSNTIIGNFNLTIQNQLHILIKKVLKGTDYRIFQMCTSRIRSESCFSSRIKSLNIFWSYNLKRTSCSMAV